MDITKILGWVIFILAVNYFSPLTTLELPEEASLVLAPNTYYETFKRIDSRGGDYQGSFGGGSVYIESCVDKILSGNTGHFTLDLLTNGKKAFYTPSQKIARLGEGQVEIGEKTYQVRAWLNLKNDENEKKVFIEVINPVTGETVAIESQRHIKEWGMASQQFSGSAKDYATLELKDPESARALIIYADYSAVVRPEYKKDVEKVRKYYASFGGTLSIGNYQCLSQRIHHKKHTVDVVVLDKNLDGNFTEEDPLMIKLKHYDPSSASFGTPFAFVYDAKYKFIFHLIQPQPEAVSQEYKLVIESVRNKK